MFFCHNISAKCSKSIPPMFKVRRKDNDIQRIFVCLIPIIKLLKPLLYHLFVIFLENRALVCTFVAH